MVRIFEGNIENINIKSNISLSDHDGTIIRKTVKAAYQSELSVGKKTEGSIDKYAVEGDVTVEERGTFEPFVGGTFEPFVAILVSLGRSRSPL